MSLAALDHTESSSHGLFTCISCSIAFLSADDQREHYRSDHHRYNMKRRVAGLPPVSAETFNEKVIQRRVETAIMSSVKGSVCDVCGKTYTTENAYRSHINSKKHKENELKAARRPVRSSSPALDYEEPIHVVDPEPESQPAPVQLETVTEQLATVALTVDADATEDEVIQTIDEKIAAARSRLQPTHCLFCAETASSLEDNIAHMSVAHSFFIPETEFLVDLPGLVTYLGEKIAVGNVCLFCNGKGREFRTLDAVRKHMLDKGHCKIAYDSDKDRLELSDYYDFTSSYPDADKRVRRKKAHRQRRVEDEADAEWEDADDVVGVDEVVEMDVDSTSGDSEDEDEDEDDVPDAQITYGDSHFELVLPSGARIGHRSMKRYYAQSFRPLYNKPEDPNSGRALVRKLIGDKDSQMVPRKGGYGAYGSGTDVVKARNRGEAREAGRHVREFRDQRRREEFRTRVGFIHNSQKHFRDPLLQ